jgi:hypothetical protein
MKTKIENLKVGEFIKFNKGYWKAKMICTYLNFIRNRNDRFLLASNENNVVLISHIPF